MTTSRQRGPRAKSINLKAHERFLLHATARSSSAPQAQRRALAMLALGRHEPVEHVASMFDVSKQTVLNWRAAWLRHREIQALIDRERSGRPRDWTEDRERLLEALLERSPAQFGFSAMSWTSQLLSNQIARASGWCSSSSDMFINDRAMY